jgi:hypothetical protein
LAIGVGHCAQAFGHAETAHDGDDIIGAQEPGFDRGRVFHGVPWTGRGDGQCRDWVCQCKSATMLSFYQKYGI